MNLHPGVAAVLRRLEYNELDLARAIMKGELASPQHYHNMWLYNMRVTGTEVSYRPSLDEWTYRRPEHYLSDEFLQRCSGLPVVMRHPDKALLNSDEFEDRVVGAVMLPYIRENEVWCIARIYSDDAVNLLNSEQMSTSPSVLLGKGDKLRLEDGSKLLVEGKPTLLDHLAIVANGVWDKGGDPTGIEADIRKDSIMAEETKKEEVKSDAEKLDMILKGIADTSARMDALCTRMDAAEEKEKMREDAARKDAAEAEEKAKKDAAEAELSAAAAKAADKRKDSEKEEKEEKGEAKMLAADKRKDSEKEEKEEEKADARADSATIAELKRLVENQSKQINALSKGINLNDEDFAKMSSIQARADSVYAQFGKQAPRPMVGEQPLAYRRRLADGVRKHSKQWKSVPLTSIVGEDAFKTVEDQIYADALVAAHTPDDLASGKIREITKTLPTGHVEHSFVGSDTHFIKQFGRPIPTFRTKDIITRSVQ